MIPDDRLRLVFTCCHPALAREAQVALTLRLVCGVSTADIAQAFLVTEPTMAARVTRAKKKISAARIPYRVPGTGRAAGPPRRRPDRRPPALHHRAHGADRRPAWCAATWSTRALDLARMLRAADARRAGGARAARADAADRRPPRDPLDADGRLLLLEEQDRSRWDRGRHRRGTRAGRSRRCAAAAGPVRAAGGDRGAACRGARRWDETDWPQILELYDVLLTRLAVAGGRAQPGGRGGDGRRAGRPRSPRSSGSSADGRLAGYRYLPATKADLLRRLGRPTEAALAYRAALDLADNDAEKRFLARRLDEVAAAR